MATIKMNVDSCRNLVSTINGAKAAIDDQITSLSGTVNGVVPADWESSSANQFQSAFQEWTTAMKQLSEQLEALNQRLASEISEFEAAAATLQ